MFTNVVSINVNDYLLLNLIGRGGSSEIYAALDKNWNTVAQWL